MERRHGDDRWATGEVGRLVARDLDDGEIEVAGKQSVIRSPPDVAGDESAPAEVFEQVAGDGGRGRFALRTGDGEHALAGRLLHPEAEAAHDGDAGGLQLGDFGPAPAHARRLHDDVPSEERLEPAPSKWHHGVPEDRLRRGRVLHDDEVGTELAEPLQVGRPLDPETPDAHAGAREVSPGERRPHRCRG